MCWNFSGSAGLVNDNSSLPIAVSLTADCLMLVYLTPVFLSVFRYFQGLMFHVQRNTGFAL